MLHICQQCGKEFQSSYGKQKFCSRQCYGESKKTGKMIICENCGKPFYRNPSKLALSEHHYCSRQCAGADRATAICTVCGRKFETSMITAKRPVLFCSQDCKKAYRRKKYHSWEGENRPTEKVCKECGKTFTTRFSHSYRQQFCSYSCAGKAKPHVAALEDRKYICRYCGKEFYDRPHRNCKYCSPKCVAKSQRRRITVRCTQCGKEYEAKPSRYEKSSYCSPKCGNQSKKDRIGPLNPLWKPSITAICEQCGCKYFVKPSRVNTTRFCSRHCHGAWLTNQCQSPTDIEIVMRGALSKLGYLFIEQYEIGWWTVDFALPLFKLVIECDGVYWHSLPKSIARDARKNTQLSNLGWQVLRFKGNIIRNDIESCIGEIQKAIRSLKS